MRKSGIARGRLTDRKLVVVIAALVFDVAAELREVAAEIARVGAQASACVWLG